MYDLVAGRKLGKNWIWVGLKPKKEYKNIRYLDRLDNLGRLYKIIISYELYDAETKKL